MDRDFLKFLIRRTLERGEVYLIERFNDEVEDRTPVEDTSSISFKTVKLDKLSKVGSSDDKFLCALTLRDIADFSYGAHYIVDWDELLTAYGRRFNFTIDEIFS